MNYTMTIEKKGKKYLHVICDPAFNVISTRLATREYAAAVVRLSSRDQWVANRNIKAGSLYAASYHSTRGHAMDEASNTTSRFRNADPVVAIVDAFKGE